MKKFKLLFLLLLFLFIIPVNAKADTINMYFFYRDGCPHCADEEVFLDSYLKEETDINLITYEISGSKENQELLNKIGEALNTPANGVPYLVVGNKAIVGYMDGVQDLQIKDIVEKTKKNDKFVDKVQKVLNGEEIETEPDEDDDSVVVPILGKINAKEVSLPLLTVIIGLADGFNPCAMWILLFLITMLINMKNRKRMWILGLTFILTSGLVYMVFMLTWLKLETFMGSSYVFNLLIALVSIGIGLFNIKKYVDTKKKADGCDVVDKKDRKKIMQKIMSITKEQKFIIALIGIIVLAASVNIIELMCSVGMPVIYTQILSMNNLSTGTYMFYILLYIFFFLFDDILVFSIAMVTSKVTGISTKYSKYSHLVAGIITLLIGLLLLINPSILMFNF